MLSLTLFGTPLWLLYKAARRRRWARVAVAVVTVMFLATLLYSAKTTVHVSPAQWIALLADAVLELVAVGLFFTPAVNRWYGQD